MGCLTRAQEESGTREDGEKTEGRGEGGRRKRLAVAERDTRDELRTARTQSGTVGNPPKTPKPGLFILLRLAHGHQWPAHM